MENITNEEIDNINNTIKNLNNICEKIDYEKILDGLDENIVLLGECTHGTKEFYEIRSNITKKLIEEKNFDIVLFEAQWTHMWNINKYINNKSDVNNAKEIMDKELKDFPKWMWNNDIIEELIEWFKIKNTKDKNINLLGIDVYSLIESKTELLRFLDSVDKEYCDKVQKLLSFMDEFNNGQEYGNSLVNGKYRQYSNHIQQLLQNLLSELQWDKLPNYRNKANKLEILNAEQSAEILVNGDEYYKKMYSEPPGSHASWNIRDQHMATTLMKIKEHFPESKIIVWAHNSHVGSALAANNGGSSFDNNNSWNLGQMCKEIFGNTHIIGFYTFNGTVRAASKWGGESEIFNINDAIFNSYEYYFHEICSLNKLKSFTIDLKDLKKSNNNEKEPIGFEYCNNFPFKIRTVNNLNKITLNKEYKSEIIIDNIPVNSIFNVTERVFVEYNISKLKIDNNGWILEYIPFGTTNKYCEPINSIKKYNNYDFFNSYRMQRWIGVNYCKNTEEQSHYGETCMIKQYDKIIYIDKTNYL